MSKSVGCGESLYHTTQSKGVVKLLNKLDHCIGHGEVHMHSMCCANQQLVIKLIFM